MANNEQGFDDLLEKLKQLADKKAGDDILVKAVGNSIKMIQAEAKRNAPGNSGELRRKIHTKTEPYDKGVRGTVYTRAEHAPYVELGAGPKGAANHSGISPHVFPSYRSTPWWIPGDEIDPRDAEKYHFIKSESADGNIFYRTSGQAAHPFLYPAAKDNEKRVKKNIANYINRKLREVADQ